MIAAAWYTLAARGVMVASAPQFGPDVPLEQREHIYYRWLVTTLPQERLYTAVAIVGFLCLAGVAAFARDLLDRDRALATVGAFLVGAGAAVWVTGSVLQLGGHRAVGLMATHINPIQTTNSIAFTIDMIGQAFTLAAFALIGAGMLAFARAAAHPRSQRRAWAGYTVLIAALMLVTAGSYAVGNGDLTDLMLLAGGVVLLPAWLIWTGRIGESGAGTPDTSRRISRRASPHGTPAPPASVSSAHSDQRGPYQAVSPVPPGAGLHQTPDCIKGARQ